MMRKNIYCRCVALVIVAVLCSGSLRAELGDDLVRALEPNASSQTIERETSALRQCRIKVDGGSSTSETYRDDSNPANVTSPTHNGYCGGCPGGNWPGQQGYAYYSIPCLKGESEEPVYDSSECSAEYVFDDMGAGCRLEEIKIEYRDTTCNRTWTGTGWGLEDDCTLMAGSTVVHTEIELHYVDAIYEYCDVADDSQDAEPFDVSISSAGHSMQFEGVLGRREEGGQIVRDDKCDWFRIDVPANSTVCVDLSVLGGASNVDPDICLYKENAAGTGADTTSGTGQIGSSSNSGHTSEKITAANCSASEVSYYVKVKMKDDEQIGEIAYKLEVEATYKANTEGAHEASNDDPSGASIAVPAPSAGPREDTYSGALAENSDDDDHWVFCLAPGKSVTVCVRHFVPTHDADLYSLEYKICCVGTSGEKVLPAIATTGTPTVGSIGSQLGWRVSACSTITNMNTEEEKCYYLLIEFENGKESASLDYTVDFTCNE